MAEAISKNLGNRMSSRKHLSSASPLAGRTSKSPTISAEYIEAIQTLNDSTLSQACEWVLDDSDMEAPGRILEVYYRCESALKIIRKNQLAANSSSPSSSLPPGVPNLNAPNLGSRIASRGSLQKMAALAGKKHVAINKGGLIPIRRTAMNKSVGRKNDSEFHNQSTHAPQAQQHHHSTQQGQTLQHAAKKARVSPPIPDNPKAPPQAALSFLKKLNKDGGGNTGSSNSNNPEVCSGGSTTTRSSISATNPSAKRSSIRALNRRSSS